MSVLLALVSAVAYGASDFLAGLMSRRAHVVVVTLTAQATAAVLTWLSLPWAGGTPDGSGVAWGALAGAGAFAGTLFLYRGLARGRMSVVGPLSAVLSAAGSAVVGVVLGDRLSALDAAGVAVACGAIAMVSLEQDAGGRRAWRARTGAGVLDGIAAGLGFALLFVGLHRAGAASRLWPVAVSQGVGLGLIAVLALGLTASGRIQLASVAGVWAGAVPAGLLGAAATIAYFAATQLGLLSVSAVLASLYPASTVVLAVAFLRERPGRVQVAGLCLAAIAVVLMVPQL